MAPDDERMMTDALSYAHGKATELESFYPHIGALPREDRARIVAALRSAFLTGYADALTRHE